ncbi:MAG TPA: FAD-dependent oxidoreductase [Anaerolineales bacterium]|nr:FAD-dependent oxidoreductase [Anaerolineales bacterium]
MREFEIIVIGKGLMGSAAARYLSQQSKSVAIIGPDEPKDQTTHPGVFASHYDEGRLTRLISRDPVWSALARMAIGEYQALETASGIPFHNPVGMLVVDSDRMASHMKADRNWAREMGVEFNFYPAGDTRWQAQFPSYRFPSDYWVLHEPAPAGMINPRAMLRAQLAVAERQGTTIIQEIVRDVIPRADGVIITTLTGEQYRAEKVLVAAGAFSHLFNLLPRPLGIYAETETIILGEVDEHSAKTYANIPTLIYFVEDPEIDDIYLTPPLRYPDGRYYIKMGANTKSDQFPKSLEEVQTWFREGDSDVHKGALERALQAILPDVRFRSFHTKRCILCRTQSGHPIVDQVSERVFVATGGNGEGAKSSDALGRLAAGLVLGWEWPGEIPLLAL